MEDPRWQDEAPMHLWQRAEGRECKMVTGIDDHSRYGVIAAAVAVPNGRAVCDVFAAAMTDHGIPSEVLTDNGKQFTSRFTKPRPAEVLFERICRENGITTRSTKPRSPTTTGEISEDCALVLHPSGSRAKEVPPYVTFRGFRGRLSPTRSTLTKARG